MPLKQASTLMKKCLSKEGKSSRKESWLSKQATSKKTLRQRSSYWDRFFIPYRFLALFLMIRTIKNDNYCIVIPPFFSNLKDFYSHSNWVELGNKVPNANLIRSDTSIGNIAGKDWSFADCTWLTKNADKECSWNLITQIAFHCWKRPLNFD